MRGEIHPEWRHVLAMFFFFSNTFSDICQPKTFPRNMALAATEACYADFLKMSLEQTRA